MAEYVCFLRFTGLRPQFKFSTAILTVKDEGSPKQCDTEERERQREQEGEQQGHLVCSPKNDFT